jgi:hypothetical protein
VISSKSQVNTLQYYFIVITFTPIDFYEQARHIRRPQTNFTVSPPFSNGILAILKNTLELEKWTSSRNQEFSQEPIGKYEDHKEIQ